MPIVHRTRQGEMLDWICWRYYGPHARLARAVFEIDPRLLDEDQGADTGLLAVSQLEGRPLHGVVEQVLAANPGLAGYGEILPAGVSITLPDLPDDGANAEPVHLAPVGRVMAARSGD
jgi:phage tail protein X